MMATSGIWNHAAQTQSLTANSSGHSAATSSPSPGSSDGSNISGNDFLSLLVTEMQNQDPTANTDPNEYINQLVQVNSLEQLISINQTLSSDLGPSATSGLQSGPAANSTAAPPIANPNLSVSGAVPATSSRLPQPGSTAGLEPQVAAGNLALPRANAAADRIAHALTVSH
jgi:flagellar basal-body rod modification protein FlgD